MKKIILIIPILILTLTSLTWGDTLPTLKDSRWYGYGIDATDGWMTTGFKIEWDIKNVGGSFPWEYNYTIYSPNKEISHWIFEVTLNAKEYDFNFGSIIYEGPKWWKPGDDPDKPGKGNPGMPDDIYGIKFDNLTGHINTFTFYSTRAPMWGDFYAKDGFERKPDPGVWVIAYNIGFGDNPEYPYTGWIAVPDTKTIVPEPGLLILLGLGLTAVGVATRFVRKV